MSTHWKTPTVQRLMNCPLRFHCQQQKGKNRRTYFLPFFAWIHTAGGMDHHNAHKCQTSGV